MEIPKEYIHRDDWYIPEAEALKLQYDRWVEDLLARIKDLENPSLQDKIKSLSNTDLLEIARAVGQAGGLMMQWPSKLRTALLKVLE